MGIKLLLDMETQRMVLKAEANPKEFGYGTDEIQARIGEFTQQREDIRRQRQERSGIVKEFLYYGLSKSKGMRSASQIEVRTKGKPYSTFLIITRGSGKASLTRADFDPRLLTRK